MIFKGDGDGRYGNGANVFAYLLNFWCYKHVVTFSLCLLSNDYHVEFQLVKRLLSLGVTVVFIMQMDKLVYSNSDSNQKDIREQQKLGGNWVVTMDITH